MLETTIENCHKYDLETILDLNNSQDFWIKRRILENESKRNWQAISISLTTHQDKNIGKN